MLVLHEFAKGTLPFEAACYAFNGSAQNLQMYRNVKCSFEVTNVELVVNARHKANFMSRCEAIAAKRNMPLLGVSRLMFYEPGDEERMKSFLQGFEIKKRIGGQNWYGIGHYAATELAYAQLYSQWSDVRSPEHDKKVLLVEVACGRRRQYSARTWKTASVL